MSESEIISNLTEYFGKEHGATVAPDDNLLEKGVLDSLAIVKLLSFLEEEFDVEIDDADFDPDNFESVRSIAGLVVQA